MATTVSETRRSLLRVLALVAGLMPASFPVPAVVGQAHPSSAAVDFIRFDGAVYLSSAYLAQGGEAAGYHPLDMRDLGPIVGHVATNRIDSADAVAYPNEPCYWALPDGTAPRLQPGDAIYAVGNFSTTFRLAAVRDGEAILYQAWCSDDARVGADLFDIYGRVERISVTGDLSERTGFATIDQRDRLDALVDMLLSGRVIPEELASDAPVTYQLIIHLDDGTTFRASTAGGEFLWG